MKSPTRDKAVLDLIITDLAGHYSTPAILPPIGKSDHSSVLFQPDSTHRPVPTTQSVTTRPMPDSRIRAFGQWITAYNWRPVLNSTSTQDKTDCFYQILQGQVDNYFPVKTTKRHSNDKPWMSSRIRNLIQKRQRAFSQGKSQLWRFLRNCVNRAIIQAKRSFTSTRLDRIDPAQPRQWYATVKQIAGMGNNGSRVSLATCEQYSGVDLATHINEYFGAICSSLPALDTNNLPAYLPSASGPPCVTRSEVWKQLARIQVHKAPGPDNIPNRLLKVFSFELSEPVTNIINCSLREGVVPSQWKEATVVPLPKVIPTPSADKLRPVSLTPTLAKVCESFAAKWMMADMSQQLDHRQFGNRKGRSTTHYLIQLIQHVHQALQDGRSTQLLTVDYSKAFDRIDINVAINKLIRMGVRRELLPWVGSFLTNRRQRVRVNGALSGWRTVTCGVPQGTKVGPVVFLAMINDVAADHPHRWKFVDDITTVTTSKRGGSQGDTQKVMDSIGASAVQDHMSVNASKCATMLVTASHSQAAAKVTAGDITIPLVESIKLLGVTVQSDLKWDTHVQNMISKANSRKYFVLVLKRAGVGQEDLVKAYCTFIRPTLEYAVQVWHPGLSEDQSDLIERVQRQVLRTILPDCSYHTALRTTGLDTLRDRRIDLCRRFANGLMKDPELRAWLPRTRGESHGRNLRNNNQLSEACPKTKRFANSPLVYMTKLLNN